MKQTTFAGLDAKNKRTRLLRLRRIGAGEACLRELIGIGYGGV